MGVYCELYRVEEEVINQFIEKQESYDYFDENYAWVGGKFCEDPTRHFLIHKLWHQVQDLLDHLDQSDDKILSKAILGAPHFIAIDWCSPRFNRAADTKKIHSHLAKLTQEDLHNCLNEEWFKSHLKRAYTQEVIEGYQQTVVEHFYYLKEAYACASAFGDGMVINLG